MKMIKEKKISSVFKENYKIAPLSRPPSSSTEAKSIEIIIDRQKFKTTPKIYVPLAETGRAHPGGGPNSPGSCGF